MADRDIEQSADSAVLTVNSTKHDIKTEEDDGQVHT